MHREPHRRGPAAGEWLRFGGHAGERGKGPRRISRRVGRDAGRRGGATEKLRSWRWRSSRMTFRATDGLRGGRGRPALASNGSPAGTSHPNRRRIRIPKCKWRFILANEFFCPRQPAGLWMPPSSGARNAPVPWRVGNAAWANVFRVTDCGQCIQRVRLVQQKFFIRAKKFRTSIAAAVPETGLKR
jgi:hypothetical protein